jgi:hypothetical protein
MASGSQVPLPSAPPYSIRLGFAAASHALPARAVSAMQCSSCPSGAVGWRCLQQGAALHCLGLGCQGWPALGTAILFCIHQQGSVCAVACAASALAAPLPPPQALQQPQAEASLPDLEQPPSPAPSEHGSFTSSLSRFRCAPMQLVSFAQDSAPGHHLSMRSSSNSRRWLCVQGRLLCMHASVHPFL